MNKITTLPVYSKLAPKEAIPSVIDFRCPDHIQLSEHQLETYEAINSGEYDVVINTAMTGDGKSLAAYLPSLVHGQELLAMYPTNELARDQSLNLLKTMAAWQCALEKPAIMNAAILERLVREKKVRSKRSGIDLLADNNEILLTNPDIFHYLAQFFYTGYNENPDSRFMRRIVSNFANFVFDEFHIFQAPQIVAVLNAMLLIREFSQHQKRFLFLSATPDEQLLAYLQRAGFRVKVVNTNGRYHHTRQPLDKAQWRRIIRESDIYFDALTTDYRIEQWIDDHLEEILQFFREQPVAKGALIVNSVASAYRLKERLAPEFAKVGRTTELNTGLSSDEVKKASRNCDLLIGTSTVDVGVDFKINFLIFESRDAGTFLQRLGRLGRHHADENGRLFTTFRAYALVPSYIEERLFKGKTKGKEQEPALLSTDAEINRETLAQAINHAHPPPARFPAYARTWGWVQSVRVYSELHKFMVRETYKKSLPNLQAQYWHTFNINIGQKWHEYNALLEESPSLIREAHSFRGESPWLCGIVDQTASGKGRVQKYDLLSLATNGDLRWIGKEKFASIAKQQGNGLAPFETDNLAGWFEFYGFLPERRKIPIDLNHKVNWWSAEKFGQPIMLSKLGLGGNDLPWLNTLNRHLRQRKFVVTLCKTHPYDLRTQLYLPPLFSLYEFNAIDHGGTIAFARQALLLHVALQNRQVGCGGSSAIIP